VSKFVVKFVKMFRIAGLAFGPLILSPLL